ncbi:MAG TPA: ATP-binding protein [Pyrinomonadaceae bacterium]|nr:ATP-binding protein [Pyrinomonadaceae bacterium]
MNEETTELVLPSRLDSIDKAAQEIAGAAARSGIDEMTLFGIDLAVREAMANAIKHGNRFDETKQVTLSFETTSEGFEIVIKDEGTGFDFENLPDPTDPENLLKESGRGAFLIRNFMDEVVWQKAPAGGTIIRMTKRI